MIFLILYVLLALTVVVEERTKLNRKNLSKLLL